MSFILAQIEKKVIGLIARLVRGSLRVSTQIKDQRPDPKITLIQNGQIVLVASEHKTSIYATIFRLRKTVLVIQTFVQEFCAYALLSPYRQSFWPNGESGSYEKSLC